MSCASGRWMFFLANDLVARLANGPDHSAGPRRTFFVVGGLVRLEAGRHPERDSLFRLCLLRRGRALGGTGDGDGGGKNIPGYGAVIGLVVGSFLTLFVLALALLLGALLFKRTAQQPGGLFRILFGAGGAFFGLLTGLFILWGGISIVRAFGAIAESGLTDKPAAEAPAIARELVRLKDSLELGPAGRLVESVDIVPPEAYDLISRTVRLSRDPDAMMRFIDYPGVQAIMQHPTMAALVEDPQIIAAAERRDVFAIMQSPKVLQAATDPELSKLLMSLDLQKALDYALPPAQSSSTPASQP